MSEPVKGHPCTYKVRPGRRGRATRWCGKPAVPFTREQIIAIGVVYLRPGPVPRSFFPYRCQGARLMKRLTDIQRKALRRIAEGGVHVNVNDGTAHGRRIGRHTVNSLLRRGLVEFSNTIQGLLVARDNP